LSDLGREIPERLREGIGGRDVTLAAPYLIWSHQHGRWMGPKREGYVRRLSSAGRYSREEAIEICSKAILGDAQALGALPELPVREEDVFEMRAAYRLRFPNRPTETWE
jgi:hypothetical protein